MTNIIPTETDLRTFRLIAEFASNKYRTPTIREICDMAGVNSSCTIHKRVARLIEAGYLHRQPHSHQLFIVGVHVAPPVIDCDLDQVVAAIEIDRLTRELKAENTARRALMVDIAALRIQLEAVRRAA